MHLWARGNTGLYTRGNGAQLWFASCDLTSIGGLFPRQNAEDHSKSADCGAETTRLFQPVALDGVGLVLREDNEMLS